MGDKIQAAREEIAIRATEMGLKFDWSEIVYGSLDDLEDTPDKYKGKIIVFLRSIRKTGIVDRNGTQTIETWNEPIVWLETVIPDSYMDYEKRVAHYIFYKPKFVVRCPELMIMI